MCGLGAMEMYVNYGLKLGWFVCDLWGKEVCVDLRDQKGECMYMPYLEEYMWGQLMRMVFEREEELRIVVIILYCTMTSQCNDIILLCD